MGGADTDAGAVPTAEGAAELARRLLADQGTRLAHVLTAGHVAARLAHLFEVEEASLLVAAATVHDIGYAPRLARTGFHPLDGALHLREAGYASRLASLVANHSLARLTVPDELRDLLHAEFPAEEGLLPDALAYSDMHSAPDGRLIHTEQRLADIAARHADPREDLRATQLRLAITRVGHALLQTPPGDPLPSARAASPSRAAQPGSAVGEPDLRAG